MPLASIFADIRPIVEAEADPRGVRVTLTCPDDLPDVMGDAAALQQAILNLAINACQAMPNGGKVYLQARLAPFATIQGQLNRAVEIKVRGYNLTLRKHEADQIWVPPNCGAAAAVDAQRRLPTSDEHRSRQS